MFLIEVTAYETVQFATPKYFTGRYNGGWPEYSVSKENAFKFRSKPAAVAVSGGLRGIGYACEVKDTGEVSA